MRPRQPVIDELSVEDRSVLLACADRLVERDVLHRQIPRPPIRWSIEVTG